MSIVQQAEDNLTTLRQSLSDSYARRTKHIVAINVLLFVAVAVSLFSVFRLIRSNAEDYGAFVLTATAGQVMILILIILGLVLHGMAIGRMTLMLVGVLRTSVDLLVNDIRALSQELHPELSELNAILERVRTRLGVTAGFAAESDNPEEAAKEERLVSSVQQLRSIFSELDSTSIAAESQRSNIDLAFFAYGFAAICLLSTGVVLVGASGQSQFPKVLLIVIGLGCAAASYIVLCRPTGPQFLIEQGLQKLGLSVEVLADSIRARGNRPLPRIDSEELFEPFAGAREGKVIVGEWDA